MPVTPEKAIHPRWRSRGLWSNGTRPRKGGHVAPARARTEDASREPSRGPRHGASHGRRGPRRCAAGQGGSLLLAGPPGIGKSALVHYAIDVASEFRRVHVAGVESEMAFGYAGVHQVVLPIVDHATELPEPQRVALDAALGRVQHGSLDPFLVGLAVLSLVADAAACPAHPGRHRRCAVAGRRVGGGAVVRRTPARRGTRPRCSSPCVRHPTHTPASTASVGSISSDLPLPNRSSS